MTEHTYAAAGVSLDAAEAIVGRLAAAVRSTRRPGVVEAHGGFAGLFELGDRLLVAGTDGVGTKLVLHRRAGTLHAAGVDCVAMCVNDVLCTGARPLFFLDYVAAGRIEPAVLGAVIDGIARGCRENGTALLGGETAEMPGFYAPGEYDVAGTIVGVVDRGKILDGSRIAEGDVALGLASAGLHTNGYSLARKVLFEEMRLAPGDLLPGEDTSVADALLAPHLSYLPALEPLLEQDLVHGMAHITGGGFYDNIPRVLPKGLDVVVKAGAWPVLPVFEVIGREGHVSFEEMHRVFNMGIGMVVFVAAGELPRVAKIWTDARRRWFAIGNVKAGRGRVLLERPPS
jgi:phosphoribosylformylglycinamidine cyclo-ligase